MTRLTVLLTGATGYIAGLLLPALRERYDLRLTDAAFAGRPLAHYLRDITGYISQRDLQQLFCKSVEAPAIEDEHGVPFQIFYGVSNNARTFWSISNARKVIGYQPEDDSEVRFAEDIARMLREQ
jgi:hypothetical protein